MRFWGKSFNAMNLVSAFLENAAGVGDKTAIVTGEGEAVSFSGLASRSGRLARHWQEAGLKKGDRVLVAMPVGIELYAAIAGLWRIGATIVFPEPALGLSGLRHAARMTSLRAFLGTGAYSYLRLVVPELWRVPLALGLDETGAGGDPLIEVGAEHPALISFTSGSTGQPKAILRSHGFLSAQNACVAELLAPQREDETDLVAFPVFVIANLGQNITSVLPNWKLSRPHGASAQEIARHIGEYNITRALVPPSICQVLADSETDVGLDMIFTGGGPVFPDLMQAMMRLSPKTGMTVVYGSTEAEPIAHQRVADISTDQWQAMEWGNGLLAGTPVPQTKVKIIDEEIVVTGDHVNKSYLGGRGDEENKLKIDGDIWHRTGDAGRLDKNGSLWLLGRHSAKAGGFYPFQVEIGARSWPGVSRVALVPGTKTPVLAIEGEEPAPGAWQKRAETAGDLQVKKLTRIPLDKRHHSKIDYRALGKLVN